MRDVYLEVKQCRRCPIVCGRQLCEKIAQNDWLVVGEQADAESASKGVPFMDRKGLQLRKLFHEVGISPRFTYLVKCESDKFLVTHWKNCRAHLFHEIQETLPKKIVMLGDNVAKRLKFNGKLLTPSKFEWGDYLGVVLPYHGGRGLSLEESRRAQAVLTQIKG